jgi:hypothetical protein
MVHDLAVEKGWWGERDENGNLPPLTTADVVTKLALVITEVTEAIEVARVTPVGELATCGHVSASGKPE